MFVISTDKLFWDAKKHQFQQEASTLNIPAGVVHKTIKLKNPKTKGTCLFNLVKHEADNGDVVAWIYKSHWPIKDLRMLIWND